MWSSRVNEDAELLELFEAVGRNVQRASCCYATCSRTIPSTAGLAREIRECEQEGDRIAHDILHRLAERGPARTSTRPTSTRSPARSTTSSTYAEEAADQLGLYGVEAPMEQALAIAEVLVSGHRAGRDRPARPARRARRRVASSWRSTGWRTSADRIVRDAVAALFAAGIDPMIVIRWKDIFETLESAVDACETVANVLEGITLKRANGRH